jgi:hypothetical protein
LTFVLWINDCLMLLLRFSLHSLAISSSVCLGVVSTIASCLLWVSVMFSCHFMGCDSVNSMVVWCCEWGGCGDLMGVILIVV